MIQQSSSSSSSSKSYSSKDSDEARDFNLLQGEGLLSSNGTIQCSGSFATFGFQEASITESLLNSSSTENENIQCHYEVELYTEGLFQIGWASKLFINQINDNNNNDVSDDDVDVNNGVGDDEYSWSFDGARAYCWHGNNAEPKSYGCKWKKGDIIGCDLVVISGGGVLLKYTLNGNDLGVAFNLEEFPVGGLFPAISLEYDECALLNFGQYSFKYGGLGNKSIADVLQMKSHNSLESKSESEELVLFTLKQKHEDISNNQEKHDEDKNNSNITIETIELESEELIDIESLLKLGDERIKADLIRRGLKSGGTTLERAQRLFSVKGLSYDKIPKKFKKK